MKFLRLTDTMGRQALVQASRIQTVRLIGGGGVERCTQLNFVDGEFMCVSDPVENIAEQLDD